MPGTLSPPQDRGPVVVVAAVSARFVPFLPSSPLLLTVAVMSGKQFLFININFRIILCQSLRRLEQVFCELHRAPGRNRKLA